MITALIVDDESKNRDSLKKLLGENCPDVEVLHAVSSAADALQVIRKQHPQLVFLDIEMPGQNGFDLLKQLDKIDFKIIFVTAHSHFAIRAIKFSAVDYLLKPVDITDLKQAVEKAIREIDMNHHAHNRGFLDNITASAANHKLAVCIKEGIAFLDTNDIIRLEADGTYTHIFCNGEKFTATKNIKEYEDILTDQHFFRSHKSHLINLKHVKSFSRTDGYFVQMRDGSRAEVSRRKQEEFMEAIGRP
ncbi:MAG: LytTR family DNA-binding domain-containing protein [Bacteroidota bacterium]